MVRVGPGDNNPPPGEGPPASPDAEEEQEVQRLAQAFAAGAKLGADRNRGRHARPQARRDTRARRPARPALQLCREGFSGQSRGAGGALRLGGGELAALSVIDSVARLRPRVLGNDQSAREESFQGATLEYPQYTRPPSFRGLDVPPVLLSGDHQKIHQWRQSAALERTRRMRPDLLKTGAKSGDFVAEMRKGLDSEGSEE